MRNEEDAFEDVLDQLATLAPGPADAPEPPAQALARLKATAPASNSRRRSVLDSMRSVIAMSNRKAIAFGLTAVVLIAVALAFPSVRAAAGDFLGLFRVQKFAPISVSPEQIALLEQLGEEGLTPGEFVTVVEPGEPQPVDNLAEASLLAKMPLRTIPQEDADLAEIYVTGGASGYMLVDLAGARAIMQAAGADPALLPDSLDGRRVDVTMSPSVQQLWPDGVILMQTASPVVAYPDDVDPTALGEALLQVLGLDAAAARQVAQSIDWTSTLLLPIPSEVATYRDVFVDGVVGVALTPLDGSAENSVMWQRNGIVHVLSGPLSVEQLVEFGDRLR